MKYLDYIIQFWKEGEIKCFCANCLTFVLRRGAFCNFYEQYGAGKC